MPDWTADDLLTGAVTSDEEVQRRCHEAMADPESVSLVVVGRNGQTVTHRINSHERTRLSVTRSYDQEQPPEDEFSYFSPIRRLWAPHWRRTTWEIFTTFDYRAEDFLGHA